MGGSAKSQKACRLKTSEAKFAKKPTTHRDNVISVHKIIYSGFPKISTVLPILTSIPQIPVKKKKRRKLKRLKRFFQLVLLMYPMSSFAHFPRFLSIITENENYKISTLLILNCKLIVISIFIYRYNQGPATV